MDCSGWAAGDREAAVPLPSAAWERRLCDPPRSVPLGRRLEACPSLVVLAGTCPNCNAAVGTAPPSATPPITPWRQGHGTDDPELEESVRVIFVWVVAGLGERPVPGHGQVMRSSATAVCAALRATVCPSGVHGMHMNTQMDRPKKVILRTLALGAALVFALAAVEYDL